jgi:hypothetical protein
VKKTNIEEEKLAKLHELAVHFFTKNEEERSKFSKKVEPNRAFLVKKNTERIKSSLEDIENAKPKKKLVRKEYKLVLSIDESIHDDIPF